MGVALVLSFVLFFMIDLALTNVEKRIVKLIKLPFKIIAGVAFILPLCIFSFLVIYEDFQLNEFHVNNDSEFVDFANSRRKFATLHTDQFFDLGISLTSTTTQITGFFFGGAYVEVPGSTQTQLDYNMYLVEFDNVIALYMASVRGSHPRIGDGLQVRKADDSLQEYYDETMIRYFAAEWDIDEDYLREILLPVALQSVWSLDYREMTATLGMICIALVLISASLTFVVLKMPFLKKHSKFGKQISWREEFSVIERKINDQLENPVFKDDDIFITKDYIIGKSSSTKSGFWYTDQLISAELQEYEEYSDGDVQYRAILSTSDDEFRFLTFDKEAIEDIATKID